MARFSPALVAQARVSKAVRGEIGDQVRQAIDRLSEADREILVLRGIEQNANETVALLLKLPANTVSVRFRRALRRLRDELPGSLLDDLD